jgi:hypothetical protein
MSENEENAPQLPKPDPALKRLDRLVGSWTINGRTLGADEDNISGRTAFEWLPGGFFLQQRIEMNFMGLPIQSLELIAYDPSTEAFSSQVFSNLAGVPLPYEWDVQGDVLTISMATAKFRGTFSEDGKSFSGGWRPDPGKEGPENVAYDVTGTRVS